MKKRKEITAKPRRKKEVITLRGFAVQLIGLLLAAALLAGCRPAASPAATPSPALPPPGVSAHTQPPATQAATEVEASSHETGAPTLGAPATPAPETAATTAPAATATENLLVMPLPEGTPAADWQGIPVMPGAMAGEEQDSGYAYTIRAGLTDLQSFYETQMAALGWMLARTGTSEQGAVILLFTRPPATTPAAATAAAAPGTAAADTAVPYATYATLTIAPQPEGFQLVLIVIAG